MSINGIVVDLEKGFDVFRGSKLLRHFSEYSEAAAYAAQNRSRYIRYWQLMES